MKEDKKTPEPENPKDGASPVGESAGPKTGEVPAQENAEPEAGGSPSGENKAENVSAEESQPAGTAPEESKAEGDEPKSDETSLLKDRLLRLQADFDNYRKRVARDHQDLVAQSNAELIKAILTPLDHLERAVDSMAKGSDENDPNLKGVKMVQTALLSALERFGLKPLDIAVGEELDPNSQEALGVLPVPGIAEGRISAVVCRGYALNGKVLRAAQVMVGSEEAGESAAAVDGKSGSAEG